MLLSGFFCTVFFTDSINVANVIQSFFMENRVVDVDQKNGVGDFIRNSSFFDMYQRQRNFILYIMERLCTLLFLAYVFCSKITMSPLDLQDVEAKAHVMNAFSIPYENMFHAVSPILAKSFVLIYLIPVFAVAVIVSFFVKKIKRHHFYMFILGALSCWLYCAVTSMIVCANTPRWFSSLPFSVVTNSIGFTFLHVFMVFYGIRFLRLQNPDYKEYVKLLKKEHSSLKNEVKKTRDRMKKRITKARDDEEKLKGILAEQEEIEESFRKEKYKIHIKGKILTTFILVISAILFIFSSSVLDNYKTLIMSNMNENGSKQAEQTASVYNFSDGLFEKINSYIEGIKKTNESTGFPWERTDIIITSSKAAIYLEQTGEETSYPKYDVFAYTTSKGKVSKIPEEEKMITPEQAAMYIENYKNERMRKCPHFDDEKKTVRYVYPITYERKAGHKLTGFSIVTYRQEVLLRPYYQTKVFVLSISFVFIYISIVLAIFLSDFIANPVIFLRCSVRKTSSRLEKLLSGSASIEAETLTFDEKTQTNDEVKDLSVEINGMVNLIRRIIPYISFSTLKSAEKSTRQQSLSREMCFLFTDIRSFTTLCEGMTPKNVVALLNHYLDIETQIIHKNGGDIDKYVGDEIMAFFTGPRKEINACKAAVELRKAMMEEKQNSLEKGEKVIEIGIGVNTGNVVFGPVGSNTRKDFTSIGDTVNLASRLEGANKEYGSKSIISEAVYEKLKDMFVCRELDYITVKGKTEPVRIYELLQSSEESSENVINIKNLFESGLEKYRKQKWDEAEKFFKECAQKYHDAPSEVFLRRIMHFRISAVDKNWNGVFVMNVK